MRTIVLFAAAFGLAAVAAAPAEARINQRQAHQQQRIAHGVASGQLTARETYRLERQEGRIAAYAEAGVAFVRPPALQPYGKVAVFLDLYGNKWDLVQFSTPATETS